MVEDLIQRESVTGILLQDAWDEFLSSRGKRGGQVVANFFNTLVRLFQVERLKRRVSTHQCVPVREQSRQQWVSSKTRVSDLEKKKKKKSPHFPDRLRRSDAKVKIPPTHSLWNRDSSYNHLKVKRLTWHIRGTTRQTLCRGPVCWAPQEPSNWESHRLF